jgi:hypothetical protein
MRAGRTDIVGAVDEHPHLPERRELRASDADRDRVALQLREALAEGRLTPEEHSERIDAVFAARTLADLEPLTADLTTSTPASTPASVRPASPAVAVFSEVKRRGRWRVSGASSAWAVFGAVRLDMREAVFDQPEVTVRTFSFCGSVNIDVPENAEVHGGGFALFGSCQVPGDVPAAPGGPVVNVTGFTLFGECVVRRGKRRRR